MHNSYIEKGMSLDIPFSIITSNAVTELESDRFLVTNFAIFFLLNLLTVSRFFHIVHKLKSEGGTANESQSTTKRHY